MVYQSRLKIQIWVVVKEKPRLCRLRISIETKIESQKAAILSPEAATLEKGSQMDGSKGAD